MSQQSKEETIQNTFMSGSVRQVVSIDYIIKAIRYGLANFDKLPKDIQKKVQDELEYREKNGIKSPFG